MFTCIVLIVLLKRTPTLATTDWGIEILKRAADLGTATTSGNVGIVAGHIILPQITGLHTMVLTLLFMAPMLYYLFHNPHPKLFVHAVRSILSCTLLVYTVCTISFLTTMLLTIPSLFLRK